MIEIHNLASQNLLEVSVRIFRCTLEFSVLRQLQQAVINSVEMTVFGFSDTLILSQELRILLARTGIASEHVWLYRLL